MLWICGISNSVEELCVTGYSTNVFRWRCVFPGNINRRVPRYTQVNDALHIDLVLPIVPVVIDPGERSRTGHGPDQGYALPVRRLAEQGRAAQGQCAGQGGASVSGDQASVRLHQGALQGLSQKHCAACNAVCAEQLVDGTSTSHRRASLSASAVQASVRKGSEKAPNQRSRALKFGDNPLRVSSGALLTIDTRESWGCADLP